MNNDKYLAHEALDRTYMVIEIIERHLVYHPYIQRDKKLMRWMNNAVNSLNKAYQHLGEETLDEEKPDENK